MPRTEKQLHDWRDPVKPRPAATILLLRDTPHGMEVLMTRRSMKASFVPGAYVFPGGALDIADGSDQARAASRVRLGQGLEQQAFSVASLREAFEELGVLLAYRADGSLATQEDVDSLDRESPDFLGQLQSHGLQLAVDRVHWLCHWVTDPHLPKRFDARFFVAPMPPGQEPEADETEQFEPIWITPSTALERHKRGDFAMIFPTIRTLGRLAQIPDVASVLAACGSDKPLWMSNPRAGRWKSEVESFSEHEPAYGELQLVAPDGQLVHTLDWQHERAVPLLKNVHRLTAPNGGRMTGPGTNTFIIGEPGAYAVIDPGPEDAAHIGRIAAFVGKDLKYILCTHSHPDHSPGAAPLKAATGAPILGAPSGPHARSTWQFAPDRILVDGERLTVGDTTLRTIHTPGHASNHLCFLMEEDRLLIAGDHINNGSTVVIDPPDGNLFDYMRSLERLQAEEIDYILPAHGWVLGFAQQAIAHLIAHRLKREAKVRDALASAKSGTLAQLLPRVYDDVDPALHPIAARSLLAHLEKLVADGAATHANDLWAIA